MLSRNPYESFKRSLKFFSSQYTLVLVFFTMQYVSDVKNVRIDTIIFFSELKSYTCRLFFFTELKTTITTSLTYDKHF